MREYEAGINQIIRFLFLTDRGISLTKLESRPKPGSPLEYLFYIDFEGSTSEDRVGKALEELRGATSYLKILGSYPSDFRI